MKNLNFDIDQIDFHDSFIKSAVLDDFGVLTIHINYYNWEGNAKDSDNWKTKTLTIKVEHCLQFKFCSPGLWENDWEIQNHESLDKHEEIIDSLKEFEEQRNTKFDNSIAVRFYTHSYGKAIFNETQGFLEIAGLNAQLIWKENETVGKPKHIPVTTKN